MMPTPPTWPRVGLFSLHRPIFVRAVRGLDAFAVVLFGTLWFVLPVRRRWRNNHEMTEADDPDA